MTNFSGASIEEQIINKINENSKNIKEIQADIKKIKRYILIRNILGIIYFVIILTPIILGIIFLPRIIENFTHGYLNQVIPGSMTGSFENIFDSYKELLK